MLAITVVRHLSLAPALALLLAAVAACGDSAEDNAAKQPKPPSHAKTVENVNQICSDFSAFIRSAPVNDENADMGEVFSKWADASKELVDDLKGLEAGAADREALTGMVDAATAMLADMRDVASTFKQQDAAGYQAAFTKWQADDKTFEAAAGDLGAESCQTQ